MLRAGRPRTGGARFVDYFNGETRTPAYRAINVMGEVPLLAARRTATCRNRA